MPSLVRPIARHTYGWNAQMQPSKYYWSAKCEVMEDFQEDMTSSDIILPTDRNCPSGENRVTPISVTSNKSDNSPVIKSWYIYGWIIFRCSCQIHWSNYYTITPSNVYIRKLKFNALSKSATNEMIPSIIA